LRWINRAVLLTLLTSGCETETRIHSEAPLRSRAPLGAGTTFPLQPSSNGRYLVDQGGVPFFIVGDSAQGLFTRLSLADAATYMDARKAQGFNTLLVEMLSHQAQIPTVPRSANGFLPFLNKAGGGSYDGTAGTADFWGNGGSSINLPYWNYIDSIMDLAAQRGMLLVLYELPWGFDGSPQQGWWSDLIDSANTKSNCQAFGAWLGARYKGRSNILWLDGSDDAGDATPQPPDNTDGITRGLAIAQGMKAAGAVQLRSGDWRAPSLSTDETAFASIMQVNGVYTYGGLFPQTLPLENNGLHTYLEARTGYEYVPTSTTQGPLGSVRVPQAIPSFLKETAYEHSSFAPGDPVSVRKAEWWALLSGGTAGLLYGDEQVWPFADGSWQPALQDESALDMQRLASLMTSIAGYKVVPSELAGISRLVTSANGSQSGEPDNYVAAAQSPDGTLFLAYVPPFGNATQSLTADLRGLSATTHARWWDPTSGSFTQIGDFSNTGMQSFTTPGTRPDRSNDWLLVISSSTAAVTPVPAVPPWAALALLALLLAVGARALPAISSAAMGSSETQ
jgi:prepilin-type processing-associated H-X9-DG protein